VPRMSLSCWIILGIVDGDDEGLAWMGTYVDVHAIVVKSRSTMMHAYMCVYFLDYISSQYVDVFLNIHTKIVDVCTICIMKSCAHVCVSTPPHFLPPLFRLPLAFRNMIFPSNGNPLIISHPAITLLRAFLIHAPFFSGQLSLSCVKVPFHPISLTNIIGASCAFHVYHSFIISSLILFPSRLHLSLSLDAGIRLPPVKEASCSTSDHHTHVHYS
jgi:hypothetical protein